MNNKPKTIAALGAASSLAAAALAADGLPAWLRAVALIPALGLALMFGWHCLTRRRAREANTRGVLSDIEARADRAYDRAHKRKRGGDR
jgi:hypothetical protein